MKRETKIFFIILIMIFFLSNYTKDYKIVSKIIDGDTFKTKDEKTIRLIGIDAPEIEERCYEEAKEKLKELIYKKRVRLEGDVKNKDKYGRLLRYVYVNDLFVNSEMIRLGLAKFEENENKKYYKLFSDLENKARKMRGCIWR